MKDPRVFVQLALGEQLCPPKIHSFKSEHHDESDDPVYPVVHQHKNEPNVLEHDALPGGHVWTFSEHSSTSAQDKPSPENPGAHLHKKEPMVFEHSDRAEQECPP